MNRTTPKLGCRPSWITGITGAAILMLGWVGPAPAAEITTPSCRLYTGEFSPEALKQRESQLKDELLVSASPAGGDHCELANIYYKLARLLPDQQVQYLNTCIDHTEKAILQDPRSGAGYFYKGLCLGRLGEINGIAASIDVLNTFPGIMETAAEIDPAIERGGPHRALGRYYFEVPWLFGGDVEKSIDHLQKAVDYGPGYWENHFFLAEAYFENDQYQLAKTALQKTIELASQSKDEPDNKIPNIKFQALMKDIESNLN
jgi:tetratricopeptide (TPR) repeat protein